MFIFLVFDHLLLELLVDSVLSVRVVVKTLNLETSGWHFGRLRQNYLK